MGTSTPLEIRLSSLSDSSLVPTLNFYPILKLKEKKMQSDPDYSCNAACNICPHLTFLFELKAETISHAARMGDISERKSK